MKAHLIIHRITYYKLKILSHIISINAITTSYLQTTELGPAQR